MTVVSIKGNDYTTPDDLATLQDDLRGMADEIDAGRLPAKRGIFLYQSQDQTISHIAVGDAITKLEAVGMLAWCLEDVKK